MLRMLIVYVRDSKKIRSTINESIDAYKNYVNGRVYYLNIIKGIPKAIYKMKFDLIIFHYTAFIFKFLDKDRIDIFKNTYRNLSNLIGLKIAIPQDEYINSESLCDIFKIWKINIILTCLPESEWKKVYPPEKTGVDIIKTVLTGYIDEKAIEKCKKYYQPHKQRPIDICYRARRYPYWLGSFAQIKSLLTDVFSLEAKTTLLRVDLSNDPADVFFNDDWYKFLSSSRTTLGCEGGASLHDFNGEIHRKVSEYCKKHPEADYHEVESKIFQGLDGNLNLKVLSPRHFEACLTKTTQVLYEGFYNGILRPNVHYIEIKQGFSNIREVIEKIQDVELCERIAEKAYLDIVESGKYTYKEFINEIISLTTDYLRYYTASREKKINRIIFNFYYFFPLYQYKYYLYSISNHIYRAVVLIEQHIEKAFKLKNNDGYKTVRKVIKKILSYLLLKKIDFRIGG